MSVTTNIAGLVASVLVWLFGYWREKRYQVGTVPLIPPFYIQFAALVAFLVLAANLIGLLTGLNWKAPGGMGGF